MGYWLWGVKAFGFSLMNGVLTKWFKIEIQEITIFQFCYSHLKDKQEIARSDSELKHKPINPRNDKVLFSFHKIAGGCCNIDLNI